MISHNKERRFTRRIPVRIESYLFTGDKTYVGFIENISENGFEYSTPTPVTSGNDLYNEKMVDLYFQIHSGEVLNLPCSVKWLSKKSTDEQEWTIGIKLAITSEKLLGVIKTLDIVNVN